MATTGRIVEIERFATHDGPGIRTAVFLKGCPLRCLWCHNPEAMRAHPELSFTPARCTACGECVVACGQGAHSLDEAAHTLDRAKCRVCGDCASACVAGGLEVIGRECTIDEVMAEVLRDRAFYRRSGGGLTVSGGEPLMQAAFTAALLQAAKREGLHCAMETSGFAPWESLESVRPWVDLFLYDCKETDAERHRQLTGQPNETILRNLRSLYETGASILLQCPIVPGCNDNEAHFEGIAALSKAMPRLVGVHILPYHPFGTDKRSALGHAAPTASFVTPSRAQVDEWCDRLRRRGVPVSV